MKNNIKRNTIILSFTTLFLFLCCLFFNTFKKNEIKANYEPGVPILTIDNDNVFLCNLDDPARDEKGVILYDYELNIFYNEIYLTATYNFINEYLGYSDESENYFVMTYNHSIQTDRYLAQEIESVSLWFSHGFDFTQYPIESSFDYSNISCELEIEIALTNGDVNYWYFTYDIVINNHFENPLIFNLSSSFCTIIPHYITLYEFSYNDGYRRGYSEGLDQNNVSAGEAYERGYNEGYQDSSLDPTEFIKKIFDGINEIFNIEIFPQFKLWYIVGAPMIVALIIAILKFLR